MKRVYTHPFAGVLSAYGMGLADLRTLREQAVEARLADEVMPELAATLDRLAGDGAAEMREQGIAPEQISVLRKAHVKYDGTDAALVVPHGERTEIVGAFEAAHKQSYGFAMSENPLVVEAGPVARGGATAMVDDPAADRPA